MTREVAWTISACIVGIIVQAIATYYIGEENFPPRARLGMGILIALAILFFVTGMNRFRISKLKAQGEGVDLMVRPAKAFMTAVKYFLVFAGVMFVVAFVTQDFDRDFGKSLDHLPIVAMGFAIFSSAYFR